MIRETYNVVQWLQDGSYEYVRRNIGPEEAVRVARHYMTSVGARIGTTRRVIITDDGDCTNLDWRYGEGIVYPTTAEGAIFPDARSTPPEEWSVEKNLEAYGGGL